MKDITKCACKDVVLVWFLILIPIGFLDITSAALRAGKAFYEQVILNQPINNRIKINPNDLKPIQELEYSKKICGLKKAVVVQLPKTETV